MEKPKRNSQQRPFFSLLFVLLIFILGFLMGFIVLKVYQDADEPPVQISLDNSSNCTPNVRDYPEPVVLDYQADNTQVAYSGGQGGGGGGNPVSLNAIQSTATALSPLYMVTPSPHANFGSNNAPVPTSVAQMQGQSLSAATPLGGNTSTVMISPATYTPMPTGTPAPMGTTVPQTGSQTNRQTELSNPLSAGEIDDNAEWDVYLTYRENFAQAGSLYSPINDVDIRSRQLIQVVDTQGEGILGATVEVLTADGTLLQTSCTYADGSTMFLPNVYPAAEQHNNFILRVSKNGISHELGFGLSSEVVMVQLDTRQALTKLDLLFLIDATGSMDDEIAAITNNILYISQEIDALPDEIDVRYALVSFKDPYYPTQVWDFTSDVNLFQSQLATLYTGGGAGETLNDGLDRSVHQVHWRGGDTVKLVFMIGDEPPGVYPEHPSYSVSMLDALYAGIKVHPIASSGLDLQGEYIFRQVAQATMGHFIFLSYDNGASTAVTTGGGSPAEGSVADEPFGQYNVAVLHEIVLNLVREELGFNTEE